MSQQSGVRAVAKPALGAAFAVGLAGLSAAPAAAAEPAAPAAPQVASSRAAAVERAAEASSNEVEELKVTARRRGSANEKLTAPILDTPRQITIIGQDAIRQTGSLTLQDALRTVPGITFNSGEGGTPSGDRPNIRGFDSTSDIFVDGIRDSGAQSREVFAVEQVEVIKGPGSAYSGRGSTGGSINIVTKQARAETFAEGVATVGTDATRRGTADVNYAFSDSAALRVNLLAHANEVAGRDAVEGERYGAAASLGLGLNGATRAYLDIYHLETDELPDFGLPYDRRTVNGVVYGSQFSGDEDAFYGLKNRDFRETDATIGTARLEHDFNPNLKISNALRYGVTSNAYVWTNPDDSRGNTANGYLFRSSKNRNTETSTVYNVTNLEAGFTTGGVRHDMLIGLELGWEETNNQGYVLSSPGLPQAIGYPSFTTPVVSNAPTAANPGCSAPGRLGATYGYNCTTLVNPNPDDPWIGVIGRSPARSTTTLDTTALYAFDTIRFGEQFVLNLGVRYDDYETQLTGVTAAAAATAPYFTTTPIVPLTNKSDFVNYQVGGIWKPVPQASLYATYATSSNPSGEGAGDSTVVSATTVNLEPEENETVEIGAKYEAFGGQLRLGASVFRIDKTNARVTDAAGATSTIGNSRVDGVELEAVGDITPNWNVLAGYTRLDSELRNGGFINIGSTTAPVYVPSTSNGNRFPNTPEHSFTLYSTYRVTRAISVGGGAVYQSERFANATNTYKVDEYWRLDANASWLVTDKISLRLNVQNLTDERYALRPFTTHGYQVAPGRSALLSVAVRY